MTCWRKGPIATRSRSLSRWIAPLAGLVLALAACTRNYPQSTLAPTSDFAHLIDGLFMTTVWWALVVFVLVEGLLLYVIFRYRRRPEEEVAPPHIHGHTRLEIAWTIAPAIILAFIGVPTIRTIFVTQDEKPIPGALNVRVLGHQWWWEFQYPEFNIVTANELHVPVGRTTSFEMTSADVIHSFWVPRLGGKRDVTPNHTNRLWFTPEATGTFTGQCAEFCGISHALMGFRVVVQSPEEFAAWVANEQRPAVGSKAAAEGAPAPPQERPQPAPREAAATPQDSVARTFAAVADPARGAQLAQGVCAACHTIRGTNARAKIGPDLTHVGSREMIAGDMLENTPENVARWLRDPPAVKPGAKMPNLNLKEDQVADLAAYLQTLK